MRHPASISVQTLAAGECRLLHAAAGTRWTVAAGRVRLTEPPRDLGGRMVAIDIRLTEGSSHRIESAGWVRMEAMTECRLVVEPAARPLAAWRAGWRLGWHAGWRQWLSRRLVYKPA